jgi:RimJ/RimL family protein N-acetyltransferase
MTLIRHAIQDDREYLLEQLREFDKFFGTKRPLFPDNDCTAMDFVGNLIENQVFFVATRRDAPRPIGFIAGYLAPHPYNPAITVLAEMFWWVDPGYRGTSAGARLLDRFITHGRLNAHWIVMTLEAKSPVDPRSLERKGFQPFERQFLLEVA